MLIKTKSGQCIISGPVVMDARKKVTGGGTEYVELVVRHGYELPDESGKRKGKLMNVQCWYNLVKLAEAVKKYDCVLICGEFQEHEYNGKMYQSVRGDFLSVMQPAKSLEAPIMADGLPFDVDEVEGQIPDSEDLPF